MTTTHPNHIESVTPVASLQVLLLGSLAIFAGTMLSAVVLPRWLPGFSASLLGDSPKVFWYLSRGSALVAFLLLWASMAMGLLITNRMARIWPGGPAVFDLHQYVSLLGLGFGLFHALILLGDQYIQMSLFQTLMPFANQNYRPLWVGVGQVAFYTWCLIIGSFYIRKRIGGKTWRWIHYASYLTFGMIMMHGIFSGSDSRSLWANIMYWTSGGSLLFLTYYRVLVTVGATRAKWPVMRRSGELTPNPQTDRIENKQLENEAQ
jgi:predicted ferric reductase